MENIGTVTAQFTADTRTFDASVKGIDRQLDAAGKSAKESAGKIADLGAVVDRTAKLQEQAKERARRAWELEAAAQNKAIDKEKELARVKELAALKADIETRAVEREAAAHKMLGVSIDKIGATLKSGFALAGVTLGLEAAIAGLKTMVTETMETGVELGKLHQQTGISTEDLSVLRFAAAQSGVEFESLTRGFKKLAVTVFEADSGNKTAAKGFQQLGISTAELKAKGDDMYAVLALLADKFKEMPDGIGKSDAAAKIFGARMGSEMIPVLNQGSAALENFKREAPIFSDADVEQMEKMHKATVDLNSSWQRMQLSIVEAIGPGMTVYLNNFAEGLDTIA